MSWHRYEIRWHAAAARFFVDDDLVLQSTTKWINGHSDALGGAVSGVNGLSTDAPGNTVVNGTISAASVTIDDPLDLNGGSVTTVGNQTYNAPLTLTADTTLSGANVTLASTVSGGGNNLTVNAGSAHVTLMRSRSWSPMFMNVKTPC